MIVALLLDTVVADGDIDLAADDRLHPVGLACIFQELLDAVEVTVVGNRNGRHTELFGPFEKIFYGRLPIQNRVLGMDVKVYETHTAKITILPDTCNYSERRCETV